MRLQNLKNISDEGLVNLLKMDDDRALDEIFNRYWEPLLKTVNRLLFDQEAAKDVVQEIMVNIWERRHVAIISNLKAYLIQAVKYQVAARLRKGKFTVAHEEVLHYVIVNNTEETIQFNELQDVVLTTLDQLPNRCSEVFYLSRFQSLSNKEIAEKLDISIRTVETQISNAIRFLRAELKSTILFLLLLIIS